MGLFNKKKAEKNCCCGSSCTPEKMEQAETVKTAAGVKVLGSGCAKCHALEDAAKAALEELNMGYNHRPCNGFRPNCCIRRDDYPCPCCGWQGCILW